MKKNSSQDWTEVLRDRLQDAQLPLEDAWGASAAVSGRTSRVWWPWAVAGVAAVLAAVLLLRPHPTPEPVRLVQVDTLAKPTIDSTTVQIDAPDAGQTEPVVSLPLSDRPRLADGSSSRRQPSPRTQPTAPDSTGQRAQAPAQTAQRLPQEATAEQREEIPGQAGDDRKGTQNDEEKAVNDSTKQYRNNTAVTPLSEIALADLEEIPDQVRDDERRRRAGRVTLRVQAGFAGASFSSGVGSMITKEIIQGAGQWIQWNSLSGSPNTSGYEDASGPSGAPDPNAPIGSSTTESEVIKWIYVPGERETLTRSVPVRQAPVFPVSFGVSAGLPLSRSWALTAGLDYMQRDGYHLYNNTPQSLTLHYLGIPLDIHYYINPESRWRFYLGAGVHVGKCIAATGGVPLQDPFLFSGSLMAGTDFRLMPGVRLYLAPTLSGFFNRSSYINTWDDKAYFQLRAGLSFDLK